MLIMNFVTWLVWWFVLFPGALAVFPPKAKRWFIEFNKTFGLVNIHLLNLPIAIGAASLVHKAHVFSHADLWLGLLIGVLYLAFYLAFLERKGVHLYIVLTPRSWLGLASYALIFGLYFGGWSAWNGVVAQ
jgi:hypothetical protein